MTLNFCREGKTRFRVRVFTAVTTASSLSVAGQAVQLPPPSAKGPPMARLVCAPLESIGKHGDECSVPIEQIQVGTHNAPPGNPMSKDPVDLALLAKIETTVDLRVPLIGDDFVFDRMFSTEPSFVFAAQHIYETDAFGLSYGPASLWNSSVFWTGESYGYSSSDFAFGNYIIRGSGRGSPVFIQTADRTGAPYTGPAFGPFVRPICAMNPTDDDQSNCNRLLQGAPFESPDGTEPQSVLDGETSGERMVFTIEEPGKWEVDFFGSSTDANGDANFTADALTRRIASQRDAHGNEWVYKYDTVGSIRDHYSNPIYKLSRILLNADTEIHFEWEDASPFRLKKVSAVRYVGTSSEAVTQFAEYTYADEDLDPATPGVQHAHADVAPLTTGNLSSADGSVQTTFGPLVRVVRGTLMDSYPQAAGGINDVITEYGDVYDLSVELYRYHTHDESDFGTGISPPSLAADARGSDGFLKSVTYAEQVEFATQKYVSDTDGDSSLEASLAEVEFSTQWLLTADSGTIGTTWSRYSPNDIASKIISYNRLTLDDADLTYPTFNVKQSNFDIVERQWLQSGCGGCGGASGVDVRLDYDIAFHEDSQIHAQYTTHAPRGESVTRVTTNERSGLGVFEPVREDLYDFVHLSRDDLSYPDAGTDPVQKVMDGSYVVAHSVRELSPTNEIDRRRWTRVFEYDWEDHVDFATGYTESIASPAAVASYTPATFSNVVVWPLVQDREDRQPVAIFTDLEKMSVTLRTDSGLVEHTDYDKHGRMLSRYLTRGSGSATAVTASSNEVLIDRWEYSATVGDAVNYFAAAYERSRTGADSGNADVFERTEFKYQFYDSEFRSLKSVLKLDEAELQTEFGPDGTGNVYQSASMYRADGELQWVASDDGALAYLDYDPVSGRVSKRVQNADKASINSESPAFVWELFFDVLDPPAGVSSWGTFAADYDTPELVTESTYDGLGRITSHTPPSGLSSYTYYQLMLEESPVPGTAGDEGRDGIAYAAMTRNPGRWTGSTAASVDGPISRTWQNAGGQPVRTSTYAADPGSYDPTIDPGSLSSSSELSRVTRVHELSGLAVKTRSWHDIDATGALGANHYDESSLEFDGRGRRIAIVDGIGTRFEYIYDDLDRLVEQRETVMPGSGMSAPAATVTRQMIYDGTTSSPEVAGSGNGNVTAVITPVEDSTVTASLSDVENRISQTVYDWRDRPIISLPPAGTGSTRSPFRVTTYDNLNRPTEVALYDGTGTAPSYTESSDTVTLPPVADRGRLERMFYSQRGLQYLRELDMDPTDGLDDALRWHTWYDGVGRTIGTWSPNGPAMKSSYDALGRVRVSYYTDRGGDDEPGTAGSYADVTQGYADGADLTGDTVFEEQHTTFADDSVVDLVESRSRLHDSTDTGALIADGTASGSNAVSTFTGYLYDEANRRVRTVDMGTGIAPGVAGTLDGRVLEAGGTAPVWPVSLTNMDAMPDNVTPNELGEWLVSRTQYNERGLVSITTDPVGDMTKYLYDDKNRKIAVIEAFQNADFASPPTVTVSAGGESYTRWSFDNSTLDASKDRVTSMYYNGVDNVVVRTAHLPGDGSEAVQSTVYTYGVTATTSAGVGDSLISTNRLLLEVAYPLEAAAGGLGAGDAGINDNDYKVRYAYNRQGERRSMIDQNGTQHVYEQDASGRVVADRVEVLGTGIDGAVRRIETDYDGFGRTSMVRSMSAVNGVSGVVIDEVGYTYTPLWNIEEFRQDHTGSLEMSGGVPLGDTGIVQYAYETTYDGANGLNHNRVSNVTYPFETAATVTYGYQAGMSTDANDRISRIVSVSASDVGVPITSYEFLGLGRFAYTAMPAVDLGLDRTYSSDGLRSVEVPVSNPPTPQVNGRYPGWDRYGRVRHQSWVQAATRPHPTTSGVPTLPELVAEVYSYSKDSKRLSRGDGRVGASRSNRDYAWSYDELDRLTQERLGAWSDPAAYGATFTESSGAGDFESQTWTLDILGNWEVHTNDFDADGTAETDDRSFNSANEYTGLEGATYPDITYDEAGSIRQRNFSSGDFVQYTHDAWNRLVKITETSSGTTVTVGEYRYNALHMRVSKVSAITLDDGNETKRDQQRWMYYTPGWQMVSERIDDDLDSGTNTIREGQYFWGKRYIDDIVMHRYKLETAGAYTSSRSHYHLTDALFSSIVIVNGSTGLIEQKVRYDAYGNGQAYRLYDRDADDANGVLDGTSFGQWLGAYNAVVDGNPDGDGIGDPDYDPDFDGDQNGVYNGLEFGMYLGTQNRPSFAFGEICRSDPDGVDNQIGYAGYVFNREQKFYTVRYRSYSPSDGRWWQRDPLGYFDGLNSYLYGGAAPIVNIDTFGLFASSPRGDAWCDSLRECFKTHGPTQRLLKKIQDAGLAYPSVKCKSGGNCLQPGQPAKYDPFLRKIVICAEQGMKPGPGGKRKSRCAILAHELAHYLYHARDGLKPPPSPSTACDPRILCNEWAAMKSSGECCRGQGFSPNDQSETKCLQDRLDNYRLIANCTGKGEIEQFVRRADVECGGLGYRPESSCRPKTNIPIAPSGTPPCDPIDIN